MAKPVSRFYYYELQAKNSEKQLIDFEVLITSKRLLFDECQSIKTNDEQTLNEFIIEPLENGFFGGRIVRSKDVDAFFAKSESEEQPSPLREKVTDVERVGDKEKDLAHFIFKPKGNRLVFVVEAGYQSIGMPKIQLVIHGLLSKIPEYATDTRVFYEPVSKDKAKVTLTSLAQRPLKRVTMQFKRSFENLPPEAKFLEQTPKDFYPEPFSLTLEIGVDHVGKKSYAKLPLVGSFLSKLLSGGNSETLYNLDFPSFLENFEITYLDETTLTVHEDILSKYLRAEIDMPVNRDHKEIFKLLVEDFTSREDVVGED